MNTDNLREVVHEYKYAYMFDVTRQGIYYEKVKLNDVADYRQKTSMVNFGDGVHSLRRSHFVDVEDSLYEIESLIKQAARKGRAGEVLFVLGYHSDPFAEYDQKYDLAMKFLGIYQKYQPGRLILQTYSNFLVLAISKIIPLKNFLTVNVIIESDDENIINKFSAGKTSALDRLKTASSLKAFGFDVEIQAAPVLPCRSLAKFVAKLTKSCHRIYVSSFTKCGSLSQRQSSPFAAHLAAAELGRWLRSGAAEPLRQEISKISPEHLQAYHHQVLANEQLGLFVA